MLSIESMRPSVKSMLGYIDEFEKSCMGEKKLSPSRFREINAELSIGAVLLIGKHRYQHNKDGKHIYWRGLDNREHDLGLVDDVKVMRDYPGFHARRSLALGNADVVENDVVDIPGHHNNFSTVKMADGSVGVGPNYRIALRNAALKMHLKKRFNRVSLSTIWNRVWGHV